MSKREFKALYRDASGDDDGKADTRIVPPVTRGTHILPLHMKGPRLAVSNAGPLLSGAATGSIA
jgi:hypothetical protein